MLDITGNIGDDARIAGGIVNINSDISDDLMVAGGRVTIGKDATIGGDLVITGGILNIEGQVKDRVFATGGNVVIAGQIGKDVRVDQVDSLTVSSSASIGGNLSYSSMQPASIAEGAEISGQLNFEQIEKERTLREKTRFGAPFAIFTATYIGGKILSFISLFVLGILLILAMPRVFEKFSQRLRISLGNSVGAGAIALFGVPLAVLVVFILSIFFMVTVIGSGIGLLLMGLNLLLAIAYFISDIPEYHIFSLPAGQIHLLPFLRLISTFTGGRYWSTWWAWQL
ncbi:MAG: polymer-forming cytoskeletal protein [Actinomycetota bacterium]|nr:polymer-forming cytoskeletal protein [Actinomycetota bacterium]